MDEKKTRSGIDPNVIDHMLVSLQTELITDRDVPVSDLLDDTDYIGFYNYIYDTVSDVAKRFAEHLLISNNAFNLPLDYIPKQKYDGPVFEGAVIELDEKRTNRWLSDLSVLEFNMMYPTLLDSVIASDVESIRPDAINNYTPINFPYVYQLVLDLYDRLKVRMRLDNPLSRRYNEWEPTPTFDMNMLEKLRKVFKKFINITYGMLGSNKTPYGHVDKSLSVLTMSLARRMMIHIKNEFAGHWLYIDTDFVVFRHMDEIRPRLLKTLKSHAIFRDCEYTIEDGKCGMFMAKKKYILAEPETVQNGKTSRVGTLHNVTVKGLIRGK